jgi:hypothetical protein
MKKPEHLYMVDEYDDMIIQPSSNLKGENTCFIRIENNSDEEDEDNFFDVRSSSAIFFIKQSKLQQVIDKLTEINEYIKEHPMNEEYLKYINKKRNE